VLENGARRLIGLAPSEWTPQGTRSPSAYIGHLSMLSSRGLKGPAARLRAACGGRDRADASRGPSPTPDHIGSSTEELHARSHNGPARRGYRRPCALPRPHREVPDQRHLSRSADAAEVDAYPAQAGVLLLRARVRQGLAESRAHDDRIEAPPFAART